MISFQNSNIFRNMLLPLKFCAFSARNNQVSDRRKSCGRPNILWSPFAFRTSVAAVSCAGKHSLSLSCSILVLFFFLFSFPFALNAGETSEKVRTIPSEHAVRLSGAGGPIFLDDFIECALLFSGTEYDDLVHERAEVYSVISELTEAVGAEKEPEARAEQVLLYMHRNLLTIYKERQTRLDVLLKEGSYNCVSSAILYTILLKSMGFKVWGIRTADHAFCRVQAGERAFDVETTSPYGFDPGSKKEFKDHFGKITGFSYVPPANYGSRQDTDEKGLLSLILYNRSAFLSELKNYEEAVAPSVDAYTLLKDSESYDRMIVSLTNLGSSYGIRRNYQRAVSFISAVSGDFKHEPRLKKLKQDLVHNWVIELINRGKLDEAQDLLDTQFQSGGIEEKEWKRLLIYTYQVKAQSLSREDFKKAASVIWEALEKVGRDSELLKSYEVYTHNQIVALLKSDQYEEAQSILDDALGIYPESSMFRKDQSLITLHMNK